MTAAIIGDSANVLEPAVPAASAWSYRTRFSDTELRAKRETSCSHAASRQRDDGSSGKFLDNRRKDRDQQSGLVMCSEIVDVPQQHERGFRPLMPCEQRPKVRVARHDHSVIVVGTLQDDRIRSVGKAEVVHVDSIVTCLDQNARDARRNVGVDEQSHAAGLGSSRSETAAAAYCKAASTSACSRYG